MKLYTEEQVRKAMNNWNEYDDRSMSEIINSLTPIELPSDEEIDNEFAPANEPINEVTYMFIEGAKWMKKQILNQNK